jgi:hypothetical protein
MVYSLMSCTGWGPAGTAILGSCSLSWFSFVIVLFLAMILRRQCSDGILAGAGFNFVGALVAGLGVNFIITYFFGSPSWSLMAGLVAMIAGGFGVGLLAPSEGGGEDYG